MTTTATPSQPVTFPSLGPRVAALRHPLYDLFKDEWEKLRDVREGIGGFRDGTYLVAHPREWQDHAAENPRIPSKKLKARRKIARYENLSKSIMEAKKAPLFREQPTRRLGSSDEATPSPIEQWWSDVDGKGTHIDDVMPTWWDLAATFGHVVLYFELPTSEESLTAADTERPYVRVYTPLDVINWLSDDNGCITSIKVVEAVQPTDYTDLKPFSQFRIRIIDQTGWRLYDFKSGGAIRQGEHQLGRVPFMYLFGQRRPILSDVGMSVLGDPRLYIDLYNMVSEKRELERNQTFSFINLPLGTGPDAMSVSDAQAMLGQQTGAMNVLFSGGAASILSADASNVATYEEGIDKLKRHIYRETGVQWEADSKDAEAEGSLTLKREDMNTRIAGYADECEQVEYQLAELFYRWQFGADRGVARLDADEVTIHYPERFSATPFDEVLQQVQSAIAVGMPSAFLKVLRKSIITKFEGMANLMPTELQEILDAIDDAPDDLTPDERLLAKANGQANAFGGKKPAKKEAA